MAFVQKMYCLFNSSGVWSRISFLWIMQQRECIKAFKIIMHDLAAMMFIVIEQAASIAKTELFHFVSFCMTRFNYVQMILLLQTLTLSQFCMPLSEKFCMFSETCPSCLLKRIHYQYG